MIINVLFVSYRIGRLNMQIIINIMRDTKKSKETLTLKTKETKLIITEEDIRKRAFEIYNNSEGSFNEKDNWFYAERELNGYYK
jgi:hypothetical protein